MNRRRGFSIVELLVAIVVALVLAALLGYELLHGAVPANELSAISTARSIQHAQFKYAQTYPAIGFADTITKLGPPPPGVQPDANHAGLLDAALDCSTLHCSRAGYLFDIDQVGGTPITSFRITAVPITPGKTGTRGFCATGLGKITADPEGGKNCSLLLASDD